MKFLIALLMLTSCASIDVRKHENGLLFPYGVYTHTVDVSGESFEDLNFIAVIEHKANDFNLVGLTPFGTTLFKANSESIEVTDKKLQGSNENLNSFFNLASSFFNLKMQKGNKMSIKRNRVRIIKRAPGGTPIEFTVKAENYTAKVSEIDYEKIN